MTCACFQDNGIIAGLCGAHHEVLHTAEYKAAEYKALADELGRALEVLLSDHQHIEPHHHHLCELCKSTNALIANWKGAGGT